jgi:hypothetical protein
MGRCRVIRIISCALRLPAALPDDVTEVWPPENVLRRGGGGGGLRFDDEVEDVPANGGGAKELLGRPIIVVDRGLEVLLAEGGEFV